MVVVVKQPTSSHLVQPIAWRRPDLGLNSKFDVCRAENLVPCAKTERWIETYPNHINDIWRRGLNTVHEIGLKPPI